jgi:hypothetical protein
MAPEQFSTVSRPLLRCRFDNPASSVPKLGIYRAYSARASWQRASVAVPLVTCRGESSAGRYRSVDAAARSNGARDAARARLSTQVARRRPRHVGQPVDHASRAAVRRSRISARSKAHGAYFGDGGHTALSCSTLRYCTRCIGKLNP